MELVGNAWQSFMDAPDYSEYSPWFPNPLICFRDIARTGVNETIERLPWNGMETWLQETWDWLYLTFYLDLNFVIYSFIVAIMLTLVRVALNFLIFKRVPIWFKLNKEVQGKFTESIWNLIIFTITWSWAAWLIVFGKEQYFFNLKSHWDKWYTGVPADPAFRWLYMFQIGFYLHGAYATVYLQTIRKDFAVLMAHHFLTISLLTFSYAVRYHIIGVLVLFIQDVGDVSLELSKIVFYFKIRGGKEHRGPEFAANICFGFFTLQHILFRLYWFPTKACYSANHVSMIVYPGGPYWMIFAVMLWALYAMQVYWFKFILDLLWKILIKGEKLEDNREYEEEERETKTMEAENKGQTIPSDQQQEEEGGGGGGFRKRQVNNKKQ